MILTEAILRPARGRVADGCWTRALAWAVPVFAGLIIAAHAVLIAGGYWDGDEFAIFAHYRDSGISFLFMRMLTWSPRPVSELVLWLYSLAVGAAQAPLIAPFLALLWATLMGCAVAAGIRPGVPGALQRHGATLCACAMFLLGHELSEMFFWPVAGAAYLLTLAALMFAFLRLLHGGATRRSDRVACGIALSVAALSSEAALFVILGFAAVQGALDAPRLLRGSPRQLFGTAWYLFPLILGFGVLVCVIRFRIGQASVAGTFAAPQFHDVVLSARATLRTLARSVLLGNAPATPTNLAAATVTHGLLLAGFFCTSRTRPGPAAPRGTMCAVWAGLLSGAVLLIFASWYQYGFWGFSRHRGFLQCLLILLILATARIAASVWPGPARPPGFLGPLCLLAAMTVAFVPRIPTLLSEYALLPEMRAAQNQSWASGEAPGTAMRFILPPRGRLITGPPWPTGAYPGPDDPAWVPWYVPGVLSFFRKDSVTIIRPGAASGPDS